MPTRIGLDPGTWIVLMTYGRKTGCPESQSTELADRRGKLSWLSKVCNVSRP